MSAVDTESQTPLEKQLNALVDEPKSWAKVFDITRLEAYGMADAAKTFLETGQLDKARKIVEGLLVINPNDGYFPALLGAICGRLGEEETALEHYGRAIELDPENLAALVNRADLLLRAGKIESALVDLAAAVKTDPHAKTPLARRAHALARATADGLHAALDTKG